MDTATLYSFLMPAESSAQALLVLSLVIGAGLALGSVRLFGLQLGVAGVLFAGLLFGHWQWALSPALNDVLREFGLILFVYTIGLQVGPRFFDSLRRFGLHLNLYAAAIVALGAALTVALSRFAGIPMAEAVGLFTGATTNTPSLAAAQQALQQLPGATPELLKLPGLSYAVAYPFGLLGLILTMVLTRRWGRIDPAQEAAAYAAAHAHHAPQVVVQDLRVENPKLDGVTVDEIPSLRACSVVVSRVFHAGHAEVALPDSVLHLGDLVRLVGTAAQLEGFQRIIGAPALAPAEAGERITTRQVLVSRRRMVGRTIEELEAFLYGITITRISRGDVEFPASAEVEIRFADRLTVVGEQAAIDFFAREVGNSEAALQQPQLIPLFVGVALGIWLGALPWQWPGLPAPVRLGMAGGPLLVSLILSRLGKLGPLIWSMPPAANLMLREIGLALFLACVGLRAGDRLVASFLSGDGLRWLLGGMLITLVPLALTAAIARARGMNYLTLCGLLAGSTTNPPALAFANQQASSNAQVVAYAAVYPLVMLLRILAAQLLVLFGSR
jgi:putative transport protein